MSMKAHLKKRLGLGKWSQSCQNPSSNSSSLSSSPCSTSNENSALSKSSRILISNRNEQMNLTAENMVSIQRIRVKHNKMYKLVVRSKDDEMEIYDFIYSAFLNSLRDDQLKLLEREISLMLLPPFNMSLLDVERDLKNLAAVYNTWNQRFDQDGSFRYMMQMDEKLEKLRQVRLELRKYAENLAVDFLGLDFCYTEDEDGEKLKAQRESLINQRNNAGNTLLHELVLCGHLALCKLVVFKLTTSGIAMTSLNAQLQTPLQLALMSRFDEIAIYMVEQQPALIGDRCAGGNNALHLAVIHAAVEDKHQRLFTVLCHHATLTHLNTYNNEGYTPVHLATKLNQCRLISILASAGADMQRKVSGTGLSSIGIAVQNNRPEAAKILYEFSTNPEVAHKNSLNDETSGNLANFLTAQRNQQVEGSPSLEMFRLTLRNHRSQQSGDVDHDEDGKRHLSYPLAGITPPKTARSESLKTISHVDGVKTTTSSTNDSLPSPSEPMELTLPSPSATNRVLPLITRRTSSSSGEVIITLASKPNSPKAITTTNSTASFVNEKQEELSPKPLLRAKGPATMVCNDQSSNYFPMNEESGNLQPTLRYSSSMHFTKERIIQPQSTSQQMKKHEVMKLKPIRCPVAVIHRQAASPTPYKPMQFARIAPTPTPSSPGERFYIIRSNTPPTSPLLSTAQPVVSHVRDCDELSIQHSFSKASPAASSIKPTGRKVSDLLAERRGISRNELIKRNQSLASGRRAKKSHQIVYDENNEEEKSHQ